MAALETRHLAELRFVEVTRALRALSAAYVERRGSLGEGRALDGAGKRAAFALFYAPLHFLLVHAIVHQLPEALESVQATQSPDSIVDLGCGTGAAGAAWALAYGARPSVIGLDRHPWAVQEATWTRQQFGLRGQSRVGDVARASWPRADAYLAAFTLNELAAEGREATLTRLLEQASRGARVLIVEPLAKSVTPWWRQAADRVVAAGGRSDEWRFSIPLPSVVEKLDRAAGLRHREVTGRSLWIGKAC
jgi:ribosomal protein RSM22 (predicted rRNA methylase)